MILPLDFPHGDHALGRALPEREERRRALQPQRRGQRPPVVLSQRIIGIFLLIDIMRENCQYLARRRRRVEHGAEALPHVGRQPEAGRRPAPSSSRGNFIGEPVAQKGMNLKEATIMQLFQVINFLISIIYLKAQDLLRLSSFVQGTR